MMGYGFKSKCLYVEDVAVMEHDFISKAHPLELGDDWARYYLAGVHDFASIVMEAIKEEDKVVDS